MRNYLDIDCPHPKQFRHTLDSTEFCALCASDRNFLRTYMDINERPGTKLVMWFPFNGRDGDVKQLKELGIKLGDVVTVETTEVYDSSTLYLREYPGKQFNTVNFGLATEADLLSVRTRCVGKMRGKVIIYIEEHA